MPRWALRSFWCTYLYVHVVAFLLLLFLAYKFKKTNVMTFLHETLFQWRTYIFHFDRIHSCLKVKTWFFAAGWLWRLWLLTDYKLRSLSDWLGTKWLAGWLVSFLVSVCYFGYVPYLENYFYWVLKIYKQFRMLAVLDYNRRSCFAFVINQYYPLFF